MLCLSGFELYSRWVPLFYLNNGNMTHLIRTLSVFFYSVRINKVSLYYVGKRTTHNGVLTLLIY